MEYIRTKDGVFELVDTYYMYVDGVETFMYDDHGRGIEINGNQILDKSDDLADLCDCLMFVDNDDEKDFLITEVNKDNLITYDDKRETCYGCIKIELPNGAIRIEPVAKAVYGDLILL